jgi:hypothetical protein
MRHFDVFTRSTVTGQVWSGQTIAAPNPRAAIFLILAQFDQNGAPLPDLADADILADGDSRVVVWPLITLEILPL